MNRESGQQFGPKVEAASSTTEVLKGTQFTQSDRSQITRLLFNNTFEREGESIPELDEDEMVIVNRNEQSEIIDFLFVRVEGNGGAKIASVEIFGSADNLFYTEGVTKLIESAREELQKDGVTTLKMTVSPGTPLYTTLTALGAKNIGNETIVDRTDREKQRQIPTGKVNIEFDLNL